MWLRNIVYPISITSSPAVRSAGLHSDLVSSTFLWQINTTIDLHLQALNRFFSTHVFELQFNKFTAAEPCRWTPLFLLFNKQCHGGMFDLCKRWPCTLHKFSIAVHYWCCIVRAISLDGKQRHLVYIKGASTCISHRAAAWPDLWLLSLRHIFLPTGDS